MSSIVALDKTGFRLGQRLERKLNPDTAGFWAEMDNRLLYRFSQVSAFKNRFSNFKQTLQKVHSYWDSFADESDEKLQLHWRECEELMMSRSMPHG